MAETNKEAFDLESVYDEQIAPLMTQIIQICAEHKLPMFATFVCMNDPDGEGEVLCTTNQMFEERPIPAAVEGLINIVYATADTAAAPFESNTCRWQGRHDNDPCWIATFVTLR